MTVYCGRLNLLCVAASCRIACCVLHSLCGQMLDVLKFMPMQFCTIPLRFMLTQPSQSRSCNPRCALNSMCSFDLRCPRMALRRKEPEHPRVLFTPLQNATPACFRKRIYARETNDRQIIESGSVVMPDYICGP